LIKLSKSSDAQAAAKAEARNEKFLIFDCGAGMGRGFWAHLGKLAKPNVAPAEPAKFPQKNLVKVFALMHFLRASG
jgi:hypothetical protein